MSTTSGSVDEPPSKRARIDPEAPKDEGNATSSVEAKSQDINPNSLAFRLAQYVETSSESLVGISGYVNPNLPPFDSGIIKHRFTDFLVWEIAKGGEVVRLKDIAKPVAPSEPESQKEENEAAQNGKDGGNDAEAKDEKELPKLEDFVTPEKAKEVQAFFEAGKASNVSVSTDPIESKDARKGFHQAIRELYQGKLESTAEDQGAIKVTWCIGRVQAKRSAARLSSKASQNLPPFIQFTLQKTNRETQDCISQLAIRLNCQVRDLATAGTKDKRAVTVQQVTVRRFKKSLEDVWAAVNGVGRGGGGGKGGRGRGGRFGGNGGSRDGGIASKQRGDRGMRIGDLKYVSEELSLGALDGNRFCIVLRDVSVPNPEVISSSLETLGNTGFINFYGMQRFGNSSVPTHAIGLAILRSDWLGACNLILSEREGDPDELVQARKAWIVDKDAKKALQGIPRWAVAERCILEFYQRDTTNHNGALSKIPKNLRMMYVHAYQSYIWNSAVSQRIQRYGCTGPIVGDLVYAEKPTSSEEAVQDGEDGEDANEKAEAVDSEKKSAKEDIVAASRVAKVKVLEEQDSDKYTIHDVVLPLPGYNVVYPGGELGQLYKDMMRADGLDPNDMFRKQREYSLGGAYRNIITRPNNLSYEVLSYYDPNHQLTQPDEDVLLDIPLPSPETDETRQGEKKGALKITFDLDTASYATMALREVLKSETGNVHQREMTENMMKKREEAAKGEEETNVSAE